MVLELAGGVRGAGKRWLTASVAKLVTRSDAASAPEAVLRLIGPTKPLGAAVLVSHDASTGGDRRPCGSQESLAARKDDCSRQKEIERGGFQAQAFLCVARPAKSSPRIGYAREACLFIARLLSDDRCCNRTYARDA